MENVHGFEGLIQALADVTSSRIAPPCNCNLAHKDAAAQWSICSDSSKAILERI